MFKLSYLILKNDLKKSTSLLASFFHINEFRLLNGVKSFLNVVFYIVLLKFITGFSSNYSAVAFTMAVMSLIHIFQAAFTTRENFLERFKVLEYSSNFKDTKQLLQLFIKIDLIKSFLLNIPYIVPSVVFAVYQGIFFIYLGYLFPILLLAMIIYFISKRGESLLTNIAWLLLSRGFILGISVATVRILLTAISIIRSAVQKSGLSFITLQTANLTLNKVIQPFIADIYSFYAILKNYQLEVYVLLTIYLVFLVLTFNNNLVTETSSKKYLPNRLFEIEDTDNCFYFADNLSIKKGLAQLHTNYLSLYFSGELCLSLGIVLGMVFSQTIHNRFIYLAVAVFLLVLIIRGTISTVKYHFQDWLRYKNELKNIQFFTIYKFSYQDLLKAKFKILHRISGFFVAIQLTAFFVLSTIIIQDLLFILLLLLLSIFLFSFRKSFVWYALKTDFTVFKLLLHTNMNTETLSDLSKFSGYKVIAASNSMFVKFSTQCNIYGMLIISSCVLISGIAWGIYDLAEMLVLLLPVYISGKELRRA